MGYFANIPVRLFLDGALGSSEHCLIEVIKRPLRETNRSSINKALECTSGGLLKEILGNIEKHIVAGWP